MFHSVASTGKHCACEDDDSDDPVCTEKPPKRSTVPGPRGRRYVAVFSLMNSRSYPVPMVALPFRLAPAAMVRGAKKGLRQKCVLLPKVLFNRKASLTVNSAKIFPTRRHSFR